MSGPEVLDLFSAAAGGWSLGMHRAGYRTIAACEVEAWRRALYSENNPGVKVYDDVRTLTSSRLLDDLGRLPAIIVGSPPCQDISSANTKGKGVEGERSGLFFEAVRLIGEIRPRWFALENSHNLRTRGADALLTALEGIGYACWPLVVRAGDIGANHERPRCWLVGCDVEQITDVPGIGFDAWAGLSRTDERDKPADVSRHAEEDGRRPGFSRGRADAVAGAEQFPCGNAAHADRDGEHASPIDGEMAELRGMGGDREPRNTPNPDQTGQADGPVVAGLRQAEIADDGCGVGRRPDEPGIGQMDLCPADRGAADGGRSGWSLADLADHLRLDDGLSAWLASQRIEVGDGKRSSAASLIVEAFGDAVIPQIPEAIGRAIMRVEQALAAIYERHAA